MQLSLNKIENKIFNFFISDTSKKRVEKSVLIVSVISFLIHLLLIYINKFEFIIINDPYNLLNNPISAIYTPFSFILIYEIYLLVYYLPRSISTYISKQYEIITLIVIRRIFKNISNFNADSDLLSNNNINIFMDLVAAIILFFLIYLFRRFSIKSNNNPNKVNLNKFIRIKKWISSLLIPSLTILGVVNLFFWIYFIEEYSLNLSSINYIFFDELFQLLILVDVLLLIISFFNSDAFHIIIRNSGFIISTILIRVSFMAEGVMNIILILGSVLFGLFILLIYNECERKNLFRIN